MDFLKVSPDEAVSKIRASILNGYQLKENLMSDYNNGPQTGAKLSNWNTLYKKWMDDVEIELVSIYCTELEAKRFLHARGTSVHIGMEHDSGEVIISLENKIELLNEYCTFILSNSNIVINAEGDVIFQQGKSPQASIQK